MMDFQTPNINPAYLARTLCSGYCGLAEGLPPIGICRVSATATPVMVLFPVCAELAPPQSRTSTIAEIMNTTKHGNRPSYFFFAIIAFFSFTMPWPAFHIARAGITFLGTVFLYALISGKLFPTSGAFFNIGGISFPPTYTRAIFGGVLSICRRGKLFPTDNASDCRHGYIIAENHSKSKIEPKYCAIAEARIEAERRQGKLF